MRFFRRSLTGLFLISLTLVFYIKLGPHRNINSLSGNLYFKFFAFFKGISQSTQYGYILCYG